MTGNWCSKPTAPILPTNRSCPLPSASSCGEVCDVRTLNRVCRGRADLFGGPRRSERSHRCRQRWHSELDRQRLLLSGRRDAEVAAFRVGERAVPESVLDLRDCLLYTSDAADEE